MNLVSFEDVSLQRNEMMLLAHVISPMQSCIDKLKETKENRYVYFNDGLLVFTRKILIVHWY